MKLYLEPSLATCANGGIRRVLEAQHKYLPEFGIDLVDTAAAAEVTATHVKGKATPGKPFVLHNHGMMWRDYDFPDWAETVNWDIVDSMRQAWLITSPSEWVTRAIARGIYKPIHTVYHGVDPVQWKPNGKHGNYVLWNKARADAVSNPKDLAELARRMPEQEFYSTIWTDNANVKVLGVVENEQMVDYVKYAGLYLATARETFGIGTLEALACGVPVVGWDYGGQSEIIVDGKTGYLAPYGDYERLADCVRNGLRDRGRLSRNALDDVQKRWQWRDKVEQYARLYYSAAAWHSAPRPKVTVIVPAHNLAKYLPTALESVTQQTLQEFECIVVDDQSTDNTSEIGRHYADQDIRFRYHKTYENLKLSGVRNLGAELALGKYLLYLDADDALPPKSLAILSQALDDNPALHVAYGALDLINEDGSFRQRNSFPQEFNWYHQMAHLNQIPTAAMMRREVVERSQGWRKRQWRAEDAEFWARVTSMGYRAQKVTDETTLFYRIRRDSKGSIEHRTYADHDGNWLACIGWRISNTSQEGQEYLQAYGEHVPQPRLVPFGAQPMPEKRYWDVYHYQEPLFTVVIVGNHKLIDTLDALNGQYINQWEVFVIGEPVTAPQYVRFLSSPEQDRPRGRLLLTLQGGEMPESDWLWNIAKEKWPELFPDGLLQSDKVLVKYMGNNTAKIPYRVNGNTYLGTKGASLWVSPKDANGLCQRGTWKRVRSTTAPEPAIIDDWDYK